MTRLLHIFRIISIIFALVPSLVHAGSEQFEVSTSQGKLVGTTEYTPVVYNNVIITKKTDSSVSLENSTVQFSSSIALHNSDNLDLTVSFASFGTIKLHLDPSRWVLTTTQSTITDCAALADAPLFKAVQEANVAER